MKVEEGEGSETSDMRHEMLKADGNHNGNSNIARARAWSIAAKPRRRRRATSACWIGRREQRLER
eukprot:5625773-Heterocapsa_arctica.AAC.2